MIQPGAENTLLWMKMTEWATSWSTLYLTTQAQTERKVKKVTESLDKVCSLKSERGALAAKS